MTGVIHRCWRRSRSPRAWCPHSWEAWFSPVDVYTGAQAGEGRKSLAYTLRFRAPDRTLTAEETTAARDAAVAEAARRVGAVLRGPSCPSGAIRTEIRRAACREKGEIS